MLHTMPVGLMLFEESGGSTPTAIESITSAMTTALQETSNNALAGIAAVLPYALAIVGAVIVVTLGIRIFKRVSGR